LTIYNIIIKYWHIKYENKNKAKEKINNMVYLDQVLPVFIEGFHALMLSGTKFVLDTSEDPLCFINISKPQDIKIELGFDENDNVELNCEIHFTSRKNPLDNTPISLTCTQNKSEKGFIIDFNSHWDQEVHDEKLEKILHYIMDLYKKNPKLKEFTIE
jgi:hypothetical protein